MTFADNWHSGMQAAASAINEAFGETLTIIPCDRQPNYEPQPHLDHAVTLTGVFSYRSVAVLDTGHGVVRRGHSPQAIVESRKPYARFAHRDLPWGLQQGDRIERCCSGEVFEVTSVQPDGVSSITVDLVQLGLPSQ